MTRLALSFWCDYLTSSSAHPPPDTATFTDNARSSSVPILRRILSASTSCVHVYAVTVTKFKTMKRRFSALNETVAAPRVRQEPVHESDTEVTDVEEHSALEVELDRGDEVLDSLKFVKKDRLRWLTQASSADTIIQALDKCGLGEGDALSRKRRRYQRRQAAPTCSAKVMGKRRRGRLAAAVEEQHDPLTKLRVFRDMKKGKGVAQKSAESASDVEKAVEDHGDDDGDDDDERMELSDIEWYTRQAVDEDDWDEDDDLDMSEVELGVMASPTRMTPEPERFKPIISFAEANNVPTCLYRPLGDIIEEVYAHLGLNTADQRGVKLLHDLLGEKRTRTSKEVGAVGVFPTRPIAAKDWAALNLSRKIIRRDRLAKSTIYRFTFTYPKDQVPTRFLRWQTWNHPTLEQIRHGLRLKLDERELTVLDTPSSPAAIEEELDNDLVSCDDEIQSEADIEAEAGEMSDVDEDTLTESEDDEELEATEVEDNEADDVSDLDTEDMEIIPTASRAIHRDPETEAEDEAVYGALGLVETPRTIAPLPRAPIFSRLPRVVNESPPQYTERSYRDRSPTPPPPFNAQTDNQVVIPLHFSPPRVVPAGLPLLLPPITLLGSPSRATPLSRDRVTSGEVRMPGSYARPAGPAPTTVASAPAPTRVAQRAPVDSFDLALDMEEAETELELAALAELEPESEREAVTLMSWGTNLVRSWWSR